MILRLLNKRVDPLLIKLPPLVAGILMWLLLPGALLLIRGWREGGLFLPFWAVRLGDLTAFPLQAYLGSRMIRQHGLHEGRWTWLYRWPIWVLLLLYGVALKFIYANWQNGIKTGSLPLKMQDSPSEKYHTWVSPAAAILLLPLAGAILASKRPLWMKIPVALLSLIGLGTGLWLDARGNK